MTETQEKYLPFKSGEPRILKVRKPGNVYGIGARVLTPEGTGEITAESKIGEYSIRIDGGGMCYYFEDDLNLEQEGE